MTRLAIHVDLDRCTGCVSCVIACKEEHHLSATVTGVRLIQVGPTGEFPELDMYYLPLACQQCGEPDCVDSCPTSAIGRGADGVVRITTEDCAGCEECLEACPYRAITFDPATGLAFKCEVCDHLLAQGGAPACVKACPGKALTLVDLDAAGAPNAAAHGVFTLMPKAGTDPTGRFILRRQKWKDRI